MASQDLPAADTLVWIASMKTVLLFLRQGISNRNLLRTDFLKTLKEHPEFRSHCVAYRR